VRVLVITNLYPPEFLGGYELGCAQMVGALADAGHEVHVVTSVSAHAHDKDERRIERILEIPPIYSPARMDSVAPDVRRYFHTMASAVNPANSRALGEVIEEFRPDVAYLWNLLGLGGLGVLALLDHQGVPWVWHIMDSIPRQLCGFATSGPQLARELSSVFPGRYIMCSSHVHGEIRAGDVDLGDSVDIVPNWVHGEEPPVREQFFRGGELRIMTASGTLSESKGTDILIESAARLRESGLANFRIDIYGREDDSRFRRLIHLHGVSDKVRLMGPRSHDELRELYGAYDLFAFPTWAREPFGFVALEAAASGCLPLVTHDCGVAEWMIDGVDCLKAIRSPDGFAERIAQILNFELDVAPLARRAHAVVWRRFHISRAVEKVERILIDAAADARRPRGGPAEFFTLARFAEGLVQALMQEAYG
jgi:glycogen synthase